MRNRYGYYSDGTQIVAPKGWKILPEFLDVPAIHRECGERYNGWRPNDKLGWLSPRRCRSTMTPIWASVAGWMRCFAVEEDFDLSTLRNWSVEAEANKRYKGAF